MTRGRLALLAATCLVASVTLATADVALPPAMRIALGLLMGLVLPGFAGTCAVRLVHELSWFERIVASMGMSLVITTCSAVLLAASPIGLSRVSLGVFLGSSTIVLSMYAAIRARVWTELRRGDEYLSNEIVQ
jgi:uncharacterized membrane protein